MDSSAKPSDLELLRSTRHGGPSVSKEEQAFGEFYARHERRLLGYLVRRTRSGELAADLCAEVFAAALETCRSGARLPDVPVAWLFGIANHKLADSTRRSRVEDRARRALQMRAVELTRGEISEIERLCDEAEASTLLDGLAPDQRAALLAHVIDEQAYGDIAAGLRCSESVVRKRVSRGLAELRVQLGKGSDAAS
jgi:RNA polymerase sigma-70 factor (ECF subfamily)